MIAPLIRMKECVSMGDHADDEADDPLDESLRSLEPDSMRVLEICSVTDDDFRKSKNYV